MSILQLLLFIESLFIGLFFRIWNMPASSPFHGDQGIDLLVALRMARGEFFPLVGPILSIPGFYNPPTYYYVLAMLLWVTGSEVVVMFLFAFLNLCSGLLYAAVIKKKVDTLTAVIFFLWYMILSSSVEQGRTIWNPYMATVFLAAGTWMFLGGNKHTMLRYAASVIVSVIGITVYPTGFSLFPIYMYYGYQYLRTVGMSVTQRNKVNTLIFALVFLFISLPQIVFEFQHSFPTINAVINSHRLSAEVANTKFVFDGSVFGYFSRGWTLLGDLYALLFPKYLYGMYLYRYGQITALIVAVFFIVSLVFLRKDSQAKKNMKVFRDFGYGYLILSFLPYFFIDSISTTHRVFIFLPFILLFFSRLLIQEITSGVIFRMMLSGACILMLLYVNISWNIFDDTCMVCSQRFDNQHKVYGYIQADAKKRKLSFAQISLRTVTDRDYFNWEVTPQWYFMKKNNGYFVEMNDDGIDTRRVMGFEEGKKYAYVICFPNISHSGDCLGQFRANTHEFIVLDEKEIAPYTIYFIKRSAEY